jgi:ribonuclease HII
MVAKRGGLGKPAEPPGLFPPRSLGVVAGVDEAGRGPLAGPVAAAAVILAPGASIPGLDDSKRLTEAEREALLPLILRGALAVGVSFAPPDEILALNIRGATLAAMRRAVLSLAVRPETVLVDGRDVPPGLACPARAIVGGDALEPSISAASIVAKVLRDRMMVRLDRACHAYGFVRHKGYGTPEHRAAIRMHGVTPHHRLGFAPFRNGT